MKKTMIFLFAGLLINGAAFAAQNTTVNCKDIAAKVAEAKKAAAANASAQPDSSGSAKTDDAQ